MPVSIELSDTGAKLAQIVKGDSIIVAVSYNGLWHLLIEKGMNKTEFRKQAGFGTATLAKLGKNEPVSLSILEKICSLLDCQIGDIVEYISGDSQE